MSYHVDSLNGDCRVDNHTLASLVIVSNNHLSPLVLIGNKRSNVRLDTTSSEANDDDSNNEATESSTVVKSGRDRSACQNEQSDDVDQAENDDGVVLSEVLIGNDGTQDWSHWRCC